MRKDLNERLAQAAEQRARLEKLRRQVAELEAEYGEAVAAAKRLKRQLSKEEADVERLEGISLSGLLASLFGNKEEQLLKERQEALAAQLKYDEARVRAERLGGELARAQQELSGLAGVEAQYQALLAEKERQMRQSPGWGAGELGRLAEREQQAAWRRKELDEARRAGMEADAALARVEETLQSAHNWGTWDMLGGGLIATAVKHSRIDEARQKLYDAQEKLSRFRRELNDVHATLQVPVVMDLDGFTRFADFFFDGLLVDIAVQSRINESLRQVERSRHQVSQALHWVGQQWTQVEVELASVQRAKQQFVEGYQDS